ncbi:MAG: hypothetical protein HYY17_08990 [Planctomycetes bacterium]|nr:hypothetical protein [Planctomycetota bacterium]
MTQPLRLDLNWIPLSGPDTDVICLLRYRLGDGLVLGVPESCDETVPWSEVRSAVVDLKSGEVRVEFTPAALKKRHWLRDQKVCSGTWLDRAEMKRPPEEP